MGVASVNPPYDTNWIAGLAANFGQLVICSVPPPAELSGSAAKLGLPLRRTAATLAGMESWQDLDDRLRGQAAKDDMSGSVLLTQAGHTIFHGCYGLADRAAGVAISPGTRFGLASVTKMFTAVAVADQVSAGRLTLTSRVVDVLPAEARPSTLHPDVTIAHLLLHTSGIADYAEEDDTFPSYLADYASLWLERPNYRMLRPLDFLPLFADLAPYRPPGQSWQYCNASYILLGIVLEHVTGRTYVDLVQERVFDRAGMSASGFLRLDEPHPDVAVGYLDPDSPGGNRRTNIYSVPVIGGPDGGAFSTVTDLDRFLHHIADNSLMGEITAEMLEPREILGDG
jgi:CubicO group peptidase (beta-lactamase class C family)